MTYLLVKWVHILSSTVLFGFGAGTAWYLWNAHRSGDPATIASGQPLGADYHRAMRLWFILGWPAFLGLTAVFWLMVAKPQLW